jgi:hypothetical protein
MKYAKIIVTLNIILFISSFRAVSPAGASGFVFNWNPFIVDADLALKIPDKETSIKKLSAADISTLISENHKDVLPAFDDHNNLSTPKSEKKSVLKNIKISFFQANTFITNGREMRKDSDDEQISKVIDSLTSLIYDNSKTKSLETIGKVFEPQINFYFEF